MIDAALILAGGKGSRLAPWHAPKCLMPINGVPILRRIVSGLADHVSKIIICTGYRGDDVVASMGRSGGALFSDAGEDASMFQRLSIARKYYDINGRILICYGDELADVDIVELVAYHEQKSSLLTFVGYKQTVPFGVVDEFLRVNDKQTIMANIGFVLVEPECWENTASSPGLSDWITKIANMGKAGCYIHKGKRATVNSLADLQYAEEIWR